MKKYIIIVIILGLGAVFWFWGKDRILTTGQSQPRYRLMRVEKRDMANAVSATGSLSAVVTVQVGTEVSGQIKDLFADFNSPVKAGQQIARIDPKGYETMLRQAEAELAMAKAGLSSQKADIQRFQAELENAQANWSAAQAMTKKNRVSLDNAQRNLERQKELVAQDFVSRNDFDTARTTYEEVAAQLEQAEAQELAAKSKVTSAKAALVVAKAQIEEAEATVALRLAALDKRKVDLDNTIIKSPVDGIVIDRNVDIGQTVAASLQAPVLFTIAQDLSRMQVSTYVDEADIGRIRDGQPALFTVDAFSGQQFNGRVSQIRKLGKSVQNVVTYEVIISADNQDMRLMPGMTAQVEIELLKKDQVWTVANAALRFTPPDVKPQTPNTPPAALANGIQPGGEAGGFQPSGGRSDPQARIRELDEKLSLSQSQKDEVGKIFQQTGQQMRAAAQNAGQVPGGMSAMREKTRKESQAAIVRILDAKQRLLYEAMTAEDRPKQGTLWRLDANGRPEAIQVGLGISDASFTEISGPAVVDGLEVITGIEQ